MNIQKFKQSPFLIIGGTSKAGTTSLFSYLASHPQICPSSLKETRFFLDADYPLTVKNSFNVDLTGYADYFLENATHEKSIFVEATPDYLYSKNALHIAELLPNAKLIFILRDPIERLISWFKYAKQRGMLDEAVSFSDYVENQMTLKLTEKTPIHLRALEQGRYSDYLPAFEQVMGDRLLVLSFEELKASPLKVINEICDFIGVDESFYSNYEFSVKNESKKIKYQHIDEYYKRVRRWIEIKVMGSKLLMRFGRWLNRYVKVILHMQYKKATDVEIDAELFGKLKKYYAKSQIK